MTVRPESAESALGPLDNIYFAAVICSPHTAYDVRSWQLLVVTSLP